jgi:predicted phage terminase large subunit-like protein
MTEAVIPSLADEGKIVDVGTVISDDCFLMWAKESPSWKVLWYAIVDEDNKPIWNERFPMERIKQIKEEYATIGNLNGFYQEYMNIPQSPESAPFKPEYIKIHNYHFSKEPGYGNCLVKERGDSKEIIPVNVYCGVDPASSLAARADFFVIVTIGIDSNNNKYIIDIFRQHISPAIQPDKIIETYVKYKPIRMKIETTAYQEALRASTKALMNDKGLYIPGLEKGVKPRSRKSERLLSLVPMLAKGEFYFRPEDMIAQQEFLSYPKGRHDDIIDATWTALENARPCRLTADSKVAENKPIRKFLDWMTM